MAFDQALADRVRGILARRRGVQERRMFGCIGFLLGGHICVGVWRDALVVRLGPRQAAAARRDPHVGDFDITGRPMRGWLRVGPEGLAAGRLEEWVGRAVRFVRTLPAR
jgi:hypothetical protein